MSTLEQSIASVAEVKSTTAVFTSWSSSSGEHLDVVLYWHPELPLTLPEEALCSVQLLDLEGLWEARLQRLHLVPSSGWRQQDLERLMRVMQRQKWQQDELRLRKETGRLVIDVHFGSENGLKKRVVEILNAYGCLGQ